MRVFLWGLTTTINTVMLPCAPYFFALLEYNYNYKSYSECLLFGFDMAGSCRKLILYPIVQFVYETFSDRYYYIFIIYIFFRIDKIIRHAQTLAIIQNMNEKSRVAPLHFKCKESLSLSAR